MKNYSIYNTSTGIIHTQGQTSADSVDDILLNSGDSIIEGEFDRAKLEEIETFC